jgi:Cu+-exporting ATPase
MCCCSNKPETSQGNVIDPVCGMSVDPATASTSQYEGMTYPFCCGGCKRKFDNAPRQYATTYSPASVRS